MHLQNNGFLSLCYHYVRPALDSDLFPRLLGIRIEEFKNQIRMLTQNYKMISLEDVRNFLYDGYNFDNDKFGMLITFDDGLSDHFHAAQILTENGIKGVFFIPTCVFVEKLPANPIIIHYALAEFGITKFLEEYRNGLKENGLDVEKFNIGYKNGDDVWKTISDLKLNFKYKLGYEESRKVLLSIYDKLLLKKYPDAMKMMHLTEEQVKEMIEMGHSIGTHSHTHISVASSKLSNEDFKKELISPKKILKDLFNTNAYSLSYPFGQNDDCLSTKELIEHTNDYELAFTVREVLNTKLTSPYEIGRYQPRSTDNTNKLNEILTKMISNSRSK